MARYLIQFNTGGISGAGTDEWVKWSLSDPTDPFGGLGSWRASGAGGAFERSTIARVIITGSLDHGTKLGLSITNTGTSNPDWFCNSVTLIKYRDGTNEQEAGRHWVVNDWVRPGQWLYRNESFLELLVPSKIIEIATFEELNLEERDPAFRNEKRSSYQ